MNVASSLATRDITRGDLSVADVERDARQGVFTLGDAQSFFGLTSKIPPLGSMLNFDVNVKR